MIAIVIIMGVRDFVIGIIVGILLAFVSYVLQTAQVSAIHGKLYGDMARSTVRRHPIQQRFLQDAGKQTCILALAGFLFFGTIVGVEKEIRALLKEPFQQQPIRFLVLDLYDVAGFDFSAAEAFTRINDILKIKRIQLVICGLVMKGSVSKGLRNVGFFDSKDGVEYFQSLNSALEYCENELLKTLYQQRDLECETGPNPAFLGKIFLSSVDICAEAKSEVPQSGQNMVSFPKNGMYNSPRSHHLQQVAKMTLSQQYPASPSRWQDYPQPLQLILQTFSTVSEQPEDFWYQSVSFFTRKSYSTGTVLYSRGDRADGFYLLESGILKAQYQSPRGTYSELIVAGTTCGELPFFSGTERTSTTSAERDCVTWMLDDQKWRDLQKSQPDVAQELRIIGLKLTSERMNTVTRWVIMPVSFC